MAEDRKGMHPAARGAVAFVVLLGAGLGALFTIGRITRGGGVIVNLGMITFGAFFAAAGVWLLGRPKGVTFAPAEGNDAFGKMQYGRAQAATTDQLRTNGAVFLVLGIGAVLLGAFFGYLA